MVPPGFPAGVIAAARVAAKGQLRLSGTGEDVFLDALAASALACAEAFCGRAWIAREWRETVGVSPAWRRLDWGPVSAIAAGAGPEQGLGVDIDGDGVGWVRADTPARVEVAYQAGDAAGWDALPAPVARGVAMLMARWFDARASDGAPGDAVAALWRPFRVVRLRVAGQTASGRAT